MAAEGAAREAPRASWWHDPTPATAIAVIALAGTLSVGAGVSILHFRARPPAASNIPPLTAPAVQPPVSPSALVASSAPMASASAPPAKSPPSHEGVK